MNKTLFLILLFFTTLLIPAEETITLLNGKTVILYDDFTWGYFESTNPEKDYSNIKATKQEIITAIEMYNQGWRYTMPRPKSNQAAWGNTDGRTTWWNGWWYNEKTNLYSKTTPQKTKNGLYLGDNQNNSHSWSNGGSPRTPDKYMFLLSSSGGPKKIY